MIALLCEHARNEAVLWPGAVVLGCAVVLGFVFLRRR